jgi:hypothetical protein
MKAFGVFGSVCKEYPLELLFQDYVNNKPEIYLNKNEADKALSKYKNNGYICEIMEMMLFDNVSARIEKKCHQCKRNVDVGDNECWFCASKL